MTSLFYSCFENLRVHDIIPVFDEENKAGSMPFQGLVFLKERTGRSHKKC